MNNYAVTIEGACVAATAGATLGCGLGLLNVQPSMLLGATPQKKQLQRNVSTAAVDEGAVHRALRMAVGGGALLLGSYLVMPAGVRQLWQKF